MILNQVKLIKKILNEIIHTWVTEWILETFYCNLWYWLLYGISSLCISSSSLTITRCLCAIPIGSQYENLVRFFIDMCSCVSWCRSLLIKSQFFFAGSDKVNNIWPVNLIGIMTKDTKCDRIQEFQSASKSFRDFLFTFFWYFRLFFLQHTKLQKITTFLFSRVIFCSL